MASTHSSREKGEKNMFIFSRNRNPVQKAVKAILVDVRTGKTHVRLGWSERFGPARSLEISFGDFAEPKRIQRFLGEMAFPYPNGKSEIEFIRELKAVANAYRAEGKRVHFVTDEVGCDAEFSCFVLPTETLGGF